MNLSGNVTLERILGPLPVPEFRYCTRCDNDMPPKRAGTKCEDCVGVENYLTRHPGGLRDAIEPGYEVSLHYPQQPSNDPTMLTLDGLKIPRMIYTAKRDEIEVAYALSLFNPEITPEWPIVLITAHGKVIDFWDGYNLQALNRIPAARNAAIHTEPIEAAVVPVPVERKQEAA